MKKNRSVRYSFSRRRYVPLETLEIQVEARDKQRKRDAKRLLRAARFPAILYGPKTAAVALGARQEANFLGRVAGLQGSHLVRLKSALPHLAEKVALVKDMQFHPISGDVIHADFYEVDLTAKIQVHVPLHFVGKAVGHRRAAAFCSRLSGRSRSNVCPWIFRSFLTLT